MYKLSYCLTDPLISALGHDTGGGVLLQDYESCCFSVSGQGFSISFYLRRNCDSVSVNEDAALHHGCLSDFRDRRRDVRVLWEMNVENYAQYLYVLSPKLQPPMHQAPFSRSLDTENVLAYYCSSTNVVDMRFTALEEHVFLNPEKPEDRYD